MRRIAFAGSILALATGVSATAGAEPLLDLSGRVALLDGVVPEGVRVTLGLDLDRDGKLNSFELVEAEVAADGSYAVSYSPDPDPFKVDPKFLQFVVELAADYEARGFDAVLDDGPLPIILRFEREGYSTIVKRFTTLSNLPSLDVVLSPLSAIGCVSDGCMSPDGSVRLSGFPGGTGIARAYARAYEPSSDKERFPGAFTDTQQNLLISSGFTEVDLRDANGDAVSAVSSPVSVRFQTNPDAWDKLRDLDADSGSIEVPMYSFDTTRGDWVSEPDGELQAEDGSTIPESDFSSIADGSYTDPVFVAFQTKHFSTFNCDAPVNERGCVQGRLVTLEGEAVVGVQVTVQGVTYTGTAGGVFTGADGYFASDLMKSETGSEDVDGNGRKGETFQAKVTASGAVGVFTSEPFDTPTAQGSIGGSSTCRAPDCDCVDIGDIEGDFELPRGCEITVNVTYSGNSLGGSAGPLAKGDAVVSAKVTGEISGGPALFLDEASCGDVPCNTGKADAKGKTTFVVPVVGDAPMLNVKADLTVSADGDVHYYTGSASVTGCGRDEDSVSAAVDLKLDHASLGDVGAFIDALGPGPSASGGTGGLFEPPDLTPKYDAPKGCACRIGSDETPASGAFSLVVGLFGFAVARRRYRSSTKPIVLPSGSR
jgi:MYXO-CTERM domain-containing protein